MGISHLYVCKQLTFGRDLKLQVVLWILIHPFIKLIFVLPVGMLVYTFAVPLSSQTMNYLL